MHKKCPWTNKTIQRGQFHNHIVGTDKLTFDSGYPSCQSDRHFLCIQSVKIARGLTSRANPRRARITQSPEETKSRSLKGMKIRSPEDTKSQSLEVNMDHPSMRTHGGRSFTSKTYHSGIFSRKTFIISRNSNTQSPKLNLDHPSMRTCGDRSFTSETQHFRGLHEQGDKKSRSSNSRNESGSSRSRGQVEENISLRECDTPEDGKKFSLKRPKARNPKLIADR
jgi:hypothetical protein